MILLSQAIAFDHYIVPVKQAHGILTPIISDFNCHFVHTFQVEMQVGKCLLTNLEGVFHILK